MTFEDKLSWRSIETNIWSAEDLKKHVMNWLLSQQYSHVILVSGYPVLTAVNLPNYECLSSSYTQVTGSHNSWKCDTGFPVVQTDREVDGLTLYSHVTTKIS